MIPGLKIGLRDWQKKLATTKASFVEIYFRLDKTPQYREMFNYLKSHHITFGLHYWGMLKAGIEPNLLSCHKWIQNQSFFQMRDALQIAVKEGAAYVNFHPGSLRERLINLDKSVFSLAKMKETPEKEGRQNFLANAVKLEQYLKKKLDNQTLLIFETIPTNSPIEWLKPRTASNFLKAKGCPIDFFLDLKNTNCFVANDFGHTLSNRVFSSDEKAWDFLLIWTRKLASQTKLIHANLSMSPFNGVDIHIGLLPQVFDLQVVPNKDQLTKLLQIFKNRSDVFIINEPEEKHEENYFELLKFLKLATV